MEKREEPEIKREEGKGEMEGRKGRGRERRRMKTFSGLLPKTTVLNTWVTIPLCGPNDPFTGVA